MTGINTGVGHRISWCAGKPAYSSWIFPRLFAPSRKVFEGPESSVWLVCIWRFLDIPFGNGRPLATPSSPDKVTQGETIPKHPIRVGPFNRSTPGQRERPVAQYCVTNTQGSPRCIEPYGRQQYEDCTTRRTLDLKG